MLSGVLRSNRRGFNHAEAVEILSTNIQISLCMSIFNKLFHRKEDARETADFETFLGNCMNGLRLQNQTHQDTWGLGKAERWDFAQDAGELIFTFSDRIVHAPAQIIGSFNCQAGSWLWAWANSTIVDSIKRDALKVREYGEQHDIKKLTTAKWRATEADCWQMAALASRLCNANGAYRGPAGATFVFFTFGEAQISKKT